MDNRPHSDWRSRSAWCWLVARETARSFSVNRGLQGAATLAFYGFLSLMPLLLLLLFIFARVLDSSGAALSAVREVTADLFPALNDEILEDLLKLANQKVWGAVSVVLLMWSMTPFAAAMRSTIRQVYKDEQRIHYLRAKVRDITAVFALLVLFVALVIARMILDAGVSGPPIMRAVGPLLVSIPVLTFFYAVFAPAGTRFSHLLAGAVPAALLLALMRPLFGVLLHYNPNFGYAFGSLKAIFLLLMWVYYTFAVLLLGAEIMANVRRRDTLLLRGLFDGRSGDASRLMEQFARPLSPGERLFGEGDDGVEMYYVQGGAVVLARDGKELKRAGPGDYFGEMSMLLHAPRTATATAAETGARVVAISQQNFDDILRENPRIVQAILKEMALRLKATNDQLMHRA